MPEPRAIYLPGLSGSGSRGELPSRAGRGVFAQGDKEDRRRVLNPLEILRAALREKNRPAPPLADLAPSDPHEVTLA